MTTNQDALRIALDALDAITDKIDGTGLAFSDEFGACIDALNVGKRALSQPAPAARCPECGEVSPAEIHTCSPQVTLCDSELSRPMCKERTCGLHADTDSEYCGNHQPVAEFPPLPEPSPTHYRESGLRIERMEMYTADQIRERDAMWQARVRAAVEQALAKLDLNSIEQYRMQMAGISSASLGYWTEGDSIHPDYDTLALRDVAKLYSKYASLAQQGIGSDSDSDSPTIAGLEASVNHLSVIVDEQLRLLKDVESICGRDDYGAEFEDGDSEIIDRVRAHLAAMCEPAPIAQQVPVVGEREAARKNWERRGLDRSADDRQHCYVLGWQDRAALAQSPARMEHVDWLGLALDLERQAKRVESQTAERAMLAAAHGLRLMGTVAPANQEPVAWFEYAPQSGAWFLAYSCNPNAKTRPLYDHPAPIAQQAIPISVIQEVISALRDPDKTKDGPSWYPGTMYAIGLAIKLEQAIASPTPEASQKEDE